MQADFENDNHNDNQNPASGQKNIGGYASRKLTIEDFFSKLPTLYKMQKWTFTMKKLK